LNGVVIVDKPKGWTSHDVVARLRKVLGVKKAGHGGTLDPLATGVLPVYLNEGTKLAPFNLEGTKDYLATMKLGQETDTLDADGKVVAETQGFSCTREEIEKILEGFRGLIRQIPPLFSAVKQGGIPLYKRARAGQTPRLPEREAIVHALILKEVSWPLVTLEVTCGRGTYIRSLCADIGRTLGCGAHLVELRRYRSGRFSLHQALSMEDICRLAEQEKITERILPLKDSVAVAGFISVDDRVAARIRQGRPLRHTDLPEGNRGWLQEGGRVGLLHGPDRLLAIAESTRNAGISLKQELPVLRILRVFHS
jgi:tRNA pseudouridine55 synthase